MTENIYKISEGERIKCNCRHCMVEVSAYYAPASRKYPKDSDVYLSWWAWYNVATITDNIRYAFKAFWSVLRTGGVMAHDVALTPDKANAVATALVRESYFARYGEYPEAKDPPHES